MPLIGHPILSCAEARALEERLLRGNERREWSAMRRAGAGIARGISRVQAHEGLLPYVAPTTDWIRLQRRFPVTLTLVDRPPDNLLFMGADARVVIFR